MYRKPSKTWSRSSLVGNSEIPNRWTSKILSAGLAICSVQATFAQETIPTFPKLEFRKWSGEINVPDPVAVSVDHLGRVFVTQTKRRKIQDLDIREHRSWLPNDLGLSNVEEKRSFFRQILAIGGDETIQSKLIEDWNEDGLHDWRDLTVVSEVIYRLVDTDDNGTADVISVFAEDFKSEVTGIAAGVMAFEGEVYATVAPDLWKLRDHNDDGRADSRESIAHGFGLHIAYGGHDMHGLTIGPDGKVYWSIGDKGINVTTSDGRNFAFPHQGGVMRCNPDGSDFEVFAHGLRNVQELAFDQYGNLFGVDNDSDQAGEKERLVYIANEMDAGWRFYYQHREDQYNPWMAERLWEMANDDAAHAASIVPPLQYSIDGPAGFKFNPGTALSPEYKNFFFLTGAPNGLQFAFRIESKGDTFERLGEHQIGEGLAIVGLAFGPDGGLYGADWDGGYPLDQKGAVIRMDVPGAEQSAARKEVRDILATGFADRDKSQLLGLLSHEDQRVRLGAQFALVRLEATDVLANYASNAAGDVLGRLHSLWGLGQLARAGDLLGRDGLVLLMRDKDSHIRGQAAKTYGELAKVDGKPLIKLLSDENLQVRVLAGLALGRQPAKPAVAALLSQAEQLTKSQHYLRHSIVTALAHCATPEELSKEVAHTSEMRRMCCLLALRRQLHPALQKYLADSSNWIATETARAIHDEDGLIAALPALANELLTRDEQTEAFNLRAINANYRLGDALAAQRVLDFASQPSRPLAQRMAALEALSVWGKPEGLDRVEGCYRFLPSEPRNLDLALLAGPLAELVASPEPSLRSLAIATARDAGVDLPLDTLQSLVVDDSADDATRVAAIESLAQRLDRLLETAAASKSDALRIRALQLLTRQKPELVVTTIGSLLESDSSSLGLKQASIRLLPTISSPSSIRLLTELGTALSDDRLDGELALDVLESLMAVADLDIGISKLVSSLNRESQDSAERKLANFKYSRDGGNVANGERLFRNHLQAQCGRCHKIGRQGSDIGPDLSKIASTRDADYLLRAILQPSADIDPKYRSQMLLLDSGLVIKGVIQSSNDMETVIADSSGNLQTVKNHEIEEQAFQTLSLMPEMTEVLSPGEVRDLVAFLRSRK